MGPTTMADESSTKDDTKAAETSFLGGSAPEAFVKGGTRTAKSEALFEQRFQEGEVRRDEADAQRKLSAGQQQVDNPEDDKASILMPGAPGGAVQYTSQFTENPEIPKSYLCITYMVEGFFGERCLADLIKGVDPSNPDELTVIIVCPGCQKDSHKHQQDNQLRIRQSNKAFEFRPGMGPRRFMFQDATSGLELPYANAGMIIESEPFSCPDCHSRYRIINNTLLEDR